jgi:metal-responsive CopG/Arc/MetJ family transcriptional regulator
MERTIISLESGLKRRLDQRAKEAGLPMAEVVREAVSEYLNKPAPASSRREHFRSLLKKTAGTWKNGDGLAWQLKLRAEWDR